MSEFCTDPNALRAILVIKYVVNILKILVPVVLIVVGIKDYFKATLESDDRAIKDATTLFIRKSIYSVLIFMIPTIIGVIFNIVSNNVKNSNETFLACFKNANKDYIKNLEDSSVCFVCSKQNRYVWSKNTPSDKCDGGWKKDVSKKTKNDCAYKPTYQEKPNPSGAANLPVDSRPNTNDPTANPGLLTDGSNISFSYQYITGDAMPYALFTPSSANDGNKKPLIIFLHGIGQISRRTGSGFEYTYGIDTFYRWPLQKFDAYVLCPHLIGKGAWAYASNEFFTLLDHVIVKYNIDPNRIALSGGSLGGSGVETLGAMGLSRFSSLTVFSGYGPVLSSNIVNNFPFRAYVEPSGTSKNYMIRSYGNRVRILNVDHGSIPKTAFYLDENHDGRSDLVDWMLSHSR